MHKLSHLSHSVGKLHIGNDFYFKMGQNRLFSCGNQEQMKVHNFRGPLSFSRNHFCTLKDSQKLVNPPSHKYKQKANWKERRDNDIRDLLFPTEQVILNEI